MNTEAALKVELLDPPGSSGVRPPREKSGVVYTRAWVVDLILDLVGYHPTLDLAKTLAVEPAAGDGAFLVAIARRLVASCRIHGRSLVDIERSLMGYELDEESAMSARKAVANALLAVAVDPAQADDVARSWVRTGDYLLDAHQLPRADFVIGNPPYIRLEDIPSPVATAYRSAYRTMRGRADIYVAFYEAALRQLKPDGVCGLICADRWMLNQYGAELRRLITEGYGVEAVTEMHHAGGFESEVSAYPAITVIRKAKQGPAVVASVGPGAGSAGGQDLAAVLDTVRRTRNGQSHTPTLRATQTQTWFSGADPWPCVSPERLALLKRLESEFYPLESEGTGTNVGIGVATGADEIFVTTDSRLVEPSRLLPLAIAGDAQKGQLHWSGHYLVNPWERGRLADLARYPRLSAYFESQRERLQLRHVGKRSPVGWYRTIDKVNHALTSKRKLYIPDIKETMHPVLDTGETYPHHNLYYVQSEGWDVEVLGGLLMSDVAQLFVECYGVRMRGGYLRFQAQYLRRIRVPRPFDLTPVQAAGLSEAFRQGDEQLATQLTLAIYGIDSLPDDDYVGR